MPANPSSIRPEPLIYNLHPDAPERDIPLPSVPAEIESQSLHQEWHKAIEYSKGKPCNLTPETLYDTITLLYDIGQNWKSKYEKAHEAQEKP